MRQRWMMLFLLWTLLGLALPLHAQDDPAPEAAIEAALSAVAQQVGERASNYQYQYLGGRSDSALGCALIATRTPLPFEMTTVQVTVSYDDASYNVLSNITGEVVILCDQQFSAEVREAPLNTACQVTPTASTPAYSLPNTNSNGAFTATPDQAYTVYGISSDNNWYQIVSDTALAWVPVTAVTVNANCGRLPLRAIINPNANTQCTVTTQSSFANLRAQATTESQQVGRIYENGVYQVSARNSNGDWFYLEPVGWVSNTVVFTVGDCIQLPVNDDAIGIGLDVVDDDGGVQVAAQTASLLEQFACPTDFAGYLVPRITTGESNARVGVGGVPNVLRAYPSTNDEQAPRLGVINPLRIVNRVIAGPACNEGIVWWLVELDGTLGWTAESNQSDNSYYLEPVATSSTPPSDQPVPVNPIVIDPPTTGLNDIQVGDNPVTALHYTADGSRLFIQTTETGFGDGTLGVIMVYDTTNGALLARIDVPTGILAIAYANEADELFVAAGDGIVTRYTAATLDETAQLSLYDNTAQTIHIAVMPDASTLFLSDCHTSPCEDAILSRLDATDGTLLNSISFGTGGISALHLNPTGTTLAVLTTDGARFYEVASFDQIASFDDPDDFPQSTILLNQAGETALVTGCLDADCTQGRILLINVGDGSVLGTVPSHQSRATHIAYNPDQTRFITVAQNSGAIIERDARTGEETQRFDLDTLIHSVQYTPDGTQLAIGTQDGRVLFINATQD